MLMTRAPAAAAYPRRGQSRNRLAGVVSDHGYRDGHRDGLLVDRQVQDSAGPWGVASTI